MKSNLRIAAALSLALLFVAHAPAPAWGQKNDDNKRAQQQQQPPPLPTPRAGERLEPDDKSVARPGVPEEALANRRERLDEGEAAEIPYYNNFLTTYLLGPEDVISVSVFDLPKYSKTGIIVPPDGRIDYSFVRCGLHVAGKTTQQVADEINHYLDEYLIDPKVMVSL